MTVDVLVLIVMWVSGILSFFLFTPKNRRRRFIFAFLICQSLAWIDALLLVNLKGDVEKCAVRGQCIFFALVQ